MPRQVTCKLCGLGHVEPRLSPGEKALCPRCGHVVARRPRLSGDAPVALCATGLILAVPAASLPFVTAGKLGAERVSLLFTGVAALWDNGMRALGGLVFLAGGVLPVALFLAIGLLHLSARFPSLVRERSPILRSASILQECAIPEVQVLAVLVALVKLGSLVNVTLGPGFWCYCAMALCLLMVERSYDAESGPGASL
jgi:paraquat-inducible protein A